MRLRVGVARRGKMHFSEFLIDGLALRRTERKTHHHRCKPKRHSDGIRHEILLVRWSSKGEFQSILLRMPCATKEPLDKMKKGVLIISREAVEAGTQLPPAWASKQKDMPWLAEKRSSTRVSEMG